MKMPEWLGRASPADLGGILGKGAGARKGGLFIRHLCRCLCAATADPRSLAALDAADGHEAGEIDGPGYEAAVREAARAVEEAEARVLEARNPLTGNYSGPAYAAAYRAGAAARVAWAVAARGYTKEALAEVRRLGGAARSRNFTSGRRAVRLLRELFFEHFGDVRRRAAVEQSWRTEAAVGLASGIYAERAFGLMPILGDALEDAGCDDADILGHCRGGGPHARGCWALDLILGLS
jgi:hypothetical protein